MATQEQPEESYKSRVDQRNPTGWLPISLVLMVGALWKVLLLVLDLFPFNADEAIVGLMAKHILEGRIPTFFYGQAYMGSLDAILVAGFMSIFGEKVWVIRLVQVILYVALIYLCYKLSRTVFRSNWAALTVAVLLAIPTVNMTLYTTVSLGGYNEALIIGVLILVMFQRVQSQGLNNQLSFFMGLLTGFGLWVFGLSLVITVPGIAVLLFRLRSEGGKQTKIGFLLAGFLVGAAPWFFGAIRLGPETLLQELFGSAIAGLDGRGIVGSWLIHTRNFLLFGPTVILGLRAPWQPQPLLPIINLIALICWVVLSVFSYKRHRDVGLTDVEKIVLISAGLLVVAFIVTPFGADPSGRYFLPLYLTLIIMAGGVVDWLVSRGRGRWGAGLIAALLLFHIGSTVQAAYRDDDGLTTQFDPVARLDFTNFPDLISFLQGEDIQHGYSNYWVAYPLAFMSDERLIFTPRLPYHQDFRYTARDNRYHPYEQQVEASDKVAYITTNHDELDRVLIGSFTKLGVDYRLAYIEPFKVYYDFSQTIRPEQLNIPEAIP